MTDLTNLASVITDQANVIQQAEQRIISTLREMHNAGATVVAYDEFNDKPITLSVLPVGLDVSEYSDVEQAVITVELSAGCRDELDFAVEA